MGTIDQKEFLEDKNSNSSVLNLPLEHKKSLNEDDSSLNKSPDLKKELMNKVYLPKEYEFQEINLEDKQEDANKKFLLEDEDDDDEEDDLEDNKCFNGDITRKRSKSFVPNMPYNNAPKPHIKMSNEQISPLKLNVKNFGNFPILNKRPNSILYDFQKDKIDSKSCNDRENQDDFELFYSETERTTPSLNDLQDLTICRKKMSNFKNCINNKTYKEYENILNSDYIFDFKKKEKNLNINHYHHHHLRRNNFWQKHIKQQQLKYSNKILNSNICDNSVKRSETANIENIKDNDLFILGILESAANEKRGRNTVNV